MIFTKIFSLPYILRKRDSPLFWTRITKFKFEIFNTSYSKSLFPYDRQHWGMEIVEGSVLVSVVATVEWTYVAIYHLSLSTCVGGPAAGIIAI